MLIEMFKDLIDSSHFSEVTIGKEINVLKVVLISVGKIEGQEIKNMPAQIFNSTVELIESRLKTCSELQYGKGYQVLSDSRSKITIIWMPDIIFTLTRLNSKNVKAIEKSIEVFLKSLLNAEVEALVFGYYQKDTIFYSLPPNISNMLGVKHLLDNGSL